MDLPFLLSGTPQEKHPQASTRHAIRRAPQCKYSAKRKYRWTASSNVFMRNNNLAWRFCCISRCQGLNKRRQCRNDDRTSTCRDRSQKDDWSTRHPILFFLSRFFFFANMSASLYWSRRPIASPCRDVRADLSPLHIQFSLSSWVMLDILATIFFILAHNVWRPLASFFLFLFTIPSAFICANSTAEETLFPTMLRMDPFEPLPNNNEVKTEKVRLFYHFWRTV